MDRLVNYYRALSELRGHEPISEGEWVKRWFDAYLKHKSGVLDKHATMALIHPQFDPLGSDGSEFEERAEGPCMIEEYVHGMQCPHELCNQVENYENDHSWPRALGGRSIESNRKTLCNSCNGTKGDNPQFWDGWGSSTPVWVSDLINAISERIAGVYPKKWGRG